MFVSSVKTVNSSRQWFDACDPATQEWRPVVDVETYCINLKATLLGGLAEPWKPWRAVKQRCNTLRYKFMAPKIAREYGGDAWRWTVHYRGGREQWGQDRVTINRISNMHTNAHILSVEFLSFMNEIGWAASRRRLLYWLIKFIYAQIITNFLWQR